MAFLFSCLFVLFFLFYFILLLKFSVSFAQKYSTFGFPPGHNEFLSNLVKTLRSESFSSYFLSLNMYLSPLNSEEIFQCDFNVNYPMFLSFSC